MQDTSLSPRLRELMIKPGKESGELFLPSSSDLLSSISHDSSSGLGLVLTAESGVSTSNKSLPKPNNSSQIYFSSRNSSPAISPTSLSFDSSPNGNKQPLYIDTAASKLSLPSPIPATRPKSSIFSLLNGLSVNSPPSSASSTASLRPDDKEKARERKHSKDKRKVSPPYSRPVTTPKSAPAPIPTSQPRSGSGFGLPPISPTNDFYSQSAPFTAPIITHRQSMYFDSRPSTSSHSAQPRHTSSSYSESDESRPGILRRHSSHPYEYSPSSQHLPRPTTAYATGPIYEAEYPGMGARAPISRTTKACNACRGRKVRCDAGGGEMGSCARCIESGTTCVYTGVQKKRGPCPGTARPSISKPRRPSTQSIASTHRSSVASVQSHIMTPTDEQPPWSARSSYGFPLPPQAYAQPDPSEWSSVAPGKARPGSSIGPTRQSISGSTTTLAWPNVEQNVEIVERDTLPGPNVRSGSSFRPGSESGPRSGSGMFDRDYALGPRNSIHMFPPERLGAVANDESRALPSLKVAFERGSYYEN